MNASLGQRIRNGDAVLIFRAGQTKKWPARFGPPLWANSTNCDRPGAGPERGR